MACSRTIFAARGLPPSLLSFSVWRPVNKKRFGFFRPPSQVKKRFFPRSRFPERRKKWVDAFFPLSLPPPFSFSPRPENNGERLKFLLFSLSPVCVQRVRRTWGIVGLGSFFRCLCCCRLRLLLAAVCRPPPPPPPPRPVAAAVAAAVAAP